MTPPLPLSPSVFVPGPESRRLSRRLAKVECPQITYLADDFPVFWARAKNCHVWDADGNKYLDLTAAFAVANLGHAAAPIVRAVRRQLEKLLHGMGDVHPPAVKVEFLEALASFAPRGLTQAILSQNGSDAIESAMKTAQIATGRDSFVAFTGGYHGLSYGALSLTARRDFRVPFRARVSGKTLHLPYPNPYRSPYGHDAGAHLRDTMRRIKNAGGGKTFAGVIVEPVQGRGGDVVPPKGWLKGLAAFCRREKILLIVDEIYTGFCRTGKRFGCDHDGVSPDLMCLGKGMTGGFPMSACIGRPALMSKWGKSRGESIHTSTFLGHPLGCAMGIAAIHEYRAHRLDTRAAALGSSLFAALRRLQSKHECIGDVRGKGLMIGIELVTDRRRKPPAPRLAAAVMKQMLRAGFLILPGGEHGNVLSFSPPLTITDQHLKTAVTRLDSALRIVY